MSKIFISLFFIFIFFLFGVMPKMLLAQNTTNDPAEVQDLLNNVCPNVDLQEIVYIPQTGQANLKFDPDDFKITPAVDALSRAESRGTQMNVRITELIDQAQNRESPRVSISQLRAGGISILIPDLPISQGSVDADYQVSFISPTLPQSVNCSTTDEDQAQVRLAQAQTQMPGNPGTCRISGGVYGIPVKIEEDSCNRPYVPKPILQACFCELPPTAPVPAGASATAGGISCDNNTGFKTAIGCIHTNPVALVKDVLKFGLGIAGGLAFLMMLLGVFQMLTSAGNPETLQTGKDRLTSAVIGLLFVIFSVLLLQIIGIGILDIPGFSR